MLQNISYINKLIQLLPVMLNAQPITHLNIKIRTQQSEEYSLSNLSHSYQEGSLDSVCVPDEMVSYRIQCIQNQQTYSARSTNSTRSSHDQGRSLLPIKSTGNIQVLPEPFCFQELQGNVRKKILGYRKCPNLAHTQIHNRAFGAMFGVIIGDAIGAHLLNKKPSTQDIGRAMMMEGGGVMGLRAGEGSDEWELNVALAEGLLEGKGKYNRDAIANKYVEWIESNPSDMPVVVGIALSEVRKKGRDGRKGENKKIGSQLLKDSQKNMKQESALGLMRLMPLVIWGLNLEDDEFQWLVKEQMKLIAPNPFAIQTAVLFAKFIRTLISTGSIEQAHREALSRVWQKGSDKLLQLWSMTEQYPEPMMHSGCASHLRFPFIYAMKEIMNLDVSGKDARQQFVEVAGRVLSKGFNTDTNCSIVLGLVGAALGYDNIPYYFREKILKSEKKAAQKRSRDYWTGGVVHIVENLLKQGPIFLDDQ